MRIGVFPYLDPSGGGIYQYSLSILRALDSWPGDDELVLVHKEDASIPLDLNLSKWELKALPVVPKSDVTKALDVLRKIVGEGPHRNAWRLLRKKIDHFLARENPPRDLNVIRPRPDLNRLFHEWRLNLAIYAWPTPLSFETDIPFIIAIHDVQHLLQPEFPEVSADGEWESREYCLRNASRYATCVLADSDVGKDDLLRCYGAHGLTEDRVKVLPFLPAPYLNEFVSEGKRARIRSLYNLPKRFLFYPAQFWPHKNHKRIVSALGLLRGARKIAPPVVFCGSSEGSIRKDALRQTMQTAKEQGVEAQVLQLGYVPDENMGALYASSTGLVMPTFFGPTNIPVLEAWRFGCPVITSDIRGIREQVGSAGLLVDPKSPEAIADGIHKIWCDDSLRTDLVVRGYERLEGYTAEDFQMRLINIIQEARVYAGC